MKDLCARNLSAAIRESTNATLAAKAEGQDDLTCDLIDRAVELLERAAVKVESVRALQDCPATPAVTRQCTGCGRPLPEGVDVRDCSGNGDHSPLGCDCCKDKDRPATKVFDVALSPSGVLICEPGEGLYLLLCEECRKRVPKTPKKKIPVPKPPVPAG